MKIKDNNQFKSITKVVKVGAKKATVNNLLTQPQAWVIGTLGDTEPTYDYDNILHFIPKKENNKGGE